MKTCLVCKNDFEPKRIRAIFCSDLCRATFHQRRKQVAKQIEVIQNNLEKVARFEKGEMAVKLWGQLLKELGNPILSDLPNYPKEKQSVANNLVKKDIPPMPQKEDFKEYLDYVEAKSEWKAKYNQS